MPQRNLNLRNTPIYKAPNGVINPIVTPPDLPKLTKNATPYATQKQKWATA